MWGDFIVLGKKYTFEEEKPKNLYKLLDIYKYTRLNYFNN